MIHYNRYKYRNNIDYIFKKYFNFPKFYFYITSTSNATLGNVKGGGDNNSAGPVTLEVVNG